MTNLGLGAVNTDGTNLTFLSHGVLQHPRDPDVKFNAHLNAGIHQIVDVFPRLLTLWNPDVIFSEYIPVGKLGANQELVIAAVTVCKAVAYSAGVEWRDIAASTVKKQLTNDGRATKVKVRNAVFEIFPEVALRHAVLKAEQKAAGEKASGLPFDTTDALAMAIIGARIIDAEIVTGIQDVREVQGDEAGDALHA